MSIISYAQNYEDVMLWRALNGIEHGFYIDVGANDPEVDSVTKLFYDNGWRGINIEPVSQWFDKLEEQRIHDINLQIAVGSASGIMTLYELPDTGLSTMDLATAERHEKDRGYQKIERKVNVETLTDICHQYHEKPIHFLKVDVEGAEKDVLKGLDLKLIRPWIVVIESTLPNTQIEDYELWENVLLETHYIFVYFDGLNRYYLADEHKELASHFKVPPNVFDDFTPQQMLNSELRAQAVEVRSSRLELELSQLETDMSQLKNDNSQLETDMSQLKNDNSQLETEAYQYKYIETKLIEAERLTKEKIDELHQSNNRLNESVSQLDEELKAVYASKSWRIMLWLRQIVHAINRYLLKPVASVAIHTFSAKVLMHNFIAKLIRFISQSPRIRSLIVGVLNQFPGIKTRLIALINSKGLRSVIHKQEQKVAQDIASPVKDDFMNARQINPQKVSKGLNDEMKSPLEKWFY